MKELGTVLAIFIVVSLIFPKELGKAWAKIEKGYKIEMNGFE